MMMMNRKLITCILFLIFSAHFANSQDNDFGIWFDINSEHRIIKRLYLDLSGSVRTFKNTSNVDEYFAEGGVSYKLNRYFSFGSSYRIINKLEDDSEYYLRHKIFAYIKASVTAGRFDFSGRIMYQRTVQTYIEDDNDLIPKNVARFRLKTVYNFPSFPAKPYLYVEPFFPVFNDKDLQIRKYRTSAGLEIKITPESSIEAGYIYENYNKSNVTDMHIFSVEYNFRF
jgi:hypothetical protein